MNQCSALKKPTMAEVHAVTSFCNLPEDCISTILSLTTPLDLCRCSPLSSFIRNAGDSNIAWEKFLPSDYQEILSSSVIPVQFSSKRELYLSLCNFVIIDSGMKSFWLEKATGKKCYMLSARELSIPWGNDQLHWSWKSIPQSRFSEVTELRTTTWLEIHGKINAQNLSPKTKYAAYLVYKIADRAYGLNSIPAEMLVQVGNHVSSNTGYIHRDSQKLALENICFLNRMEILKSRVMEGGEKVSCDREDGWKEIELGYFYVDAGNEGEVKMSFMEVKGEHLKGGLVLEGIEIRPKQ